jgi:DNA-binding beta-propeller fold protein YncE
VKFGGVTAVPDQLRETSMTVTVPAGVPVGPLTVTVEISTASGPTVSNGLAFEVLGASTGALRLSTMPQPSGIPELGWVMSASPKGDLVVVTERTLPLNQGKLHLLDTDAASSGFGQFVDVPTAAVFDTTITDVAIAPDGKRLYVTFEEGDSVSVVDVDRLSPTFGERVGVIATSPSLPGGRAHVAVSPDGEIGLAVDDDITSIIDLAAGSPTRYQTVDTVHTTGWPYEVVFHPTRTTAYLAQTNPDVIRVIDVDPTSINFADEIATIPSPVAGGTPVSLSFSPDGSRCLALTRRIQQPWSRTVVTLDTSDPLTPTILDQQAFAGGEFTAFEPFVEPIDISPRGDRALFHQATVGFNHFDVTVMPYPSVETAYDFLLIEYLDNDYAPDASNFYAVSAGHDAVFVFDFNAAQTLEVESGDLQTGVVDQSLAHQARRPSAAFRSRSRSRRAEVYSPPPTARFRSS